MAEASSRCPICGVDTPHEHDAQTVKEYREGQLYFGRIQLEKYREIEKRRKTVDEKMLAEFQRRIDIAVSNMTKYVAACPCCRIARVGDAFIKDTIGTLYVYDYGWNTSNGGDIVRCPECGSCLWDKT